MCVCTTRRSQSAIVEGVFPISKDSNVKDAFCVLVFERVSNSAVTLKEKPSRMALGVERNSGSGQKYYVQNVNIINPFEHRELSKWQSSMAQMVAEACRSIDGTMHKMAESYQASYKPMDVNNK